MSSAAGGEEEESAGYSKLEFTYAPAPSTAVEVAVEFDLDRRTMTDALELHERNNGAAAESIDLGVLSGLVEVFNHYNNDMIKRYDYSVESETRFEVQVLFRHLFKKMGESQKYAHFKVELVERPATAVGGRQGKIVFHKVLERNSNPAFFQVKDAAEFLPVKNLVALYRVEDAPTSSSAVAAAAQAKSRVFVKVCYSETPSAGAAGAGNSDLVRDLMREALQSLFRDMKRHVSFDAATNQVRVSPPPPKADYK